MRYKITFKFTLDEVENYFGFVSDSIEGMFGECDTFIEEDINDIVEYLVSNRFGKHNLFALLMSKSEEYQYAKNIMKDYLDNKIDTFSLYHDINFQEYLREKYLMNVLETYAYAYEDYIDDENE